MKFSYSAVWNDAVEMLRANAAILAALAGVFFLLPDLAFLYFFPPPEGSGGGNPNDAIRIIVEYYEASWPWMVLDGIVKMIGGISMLLILLGPRTTVGGAIASALLILPFYFIASCLSGIMIGVGFLLLLVPGLYLLGRLVLVGPAVVLEGQRNPIAAIGRSFELTRDNGWAVLGLILLITIAGYVIITVAVWLLGSVLILAAGRDVGAFLAQIVQTLGVAALNTVVVALIASLYRALGGRSASAA
jgi:hypothetical protein